MGDVLRHAAGEQLGHGAQAAVPGHDQVGVLALGAATAAARPPAPAPSRGAAAARGSAFRRPADLSGGKGSGLEDGLDVENDLYPVADGHAAARDRAVEADAEVGAVDLARCRE